MPLRQFQVLQESWGAVFSALDQAYPVVSHFGSPEKEYQNAHETAVLFDLSTRDQIEISGKDRDKFLHNFCTNDIKGLQPDQGCEAFITNVQSRILGHVFAFNHEDSLWIDMAPGTSESIINHLDRYMILEDVHIKQRTPEYGNLYLSGPQSSDLLNQIGLDVKTLSVNQQLRGKSSNSELTIRRVDWLYQPGYLCCLQYVKISEFWKSLVEAGACPAGQNIFDALRIEALFPIYGVDLTEENLAQEANRTEQAISFKKGCYLGQEPIARIDALGHVNRELRAIGMEQKWVPPVGSKVMAGEPDKLMEVGTITSSAQSFGKFPSVAMAMIRRDSNEPGTVVQIVSDHQEVTGTIFTSLD
ncbi:CAF17-like 4Fe-4S cluster assembly/insertion protein YgfZ [Gimesia aquarii]|uniref:Aminomethyltransferase n=1 Tax=Gimesia aquarii TaxID=2527964 RepID=A0A517W4X8_9PLAN|nr:folate-binding protein YgfZ [Gimesia aquarii]QDU00306.1 Aminomethyltransferase [Gimesia aquarii]